MGTKSSPKFPGGGAITRPQATELQAGSEHSRHNQQQTWRPIPWPANANAGATHQYEHCQRRQSHRDNKSPADSNSKSQHEKQENRQSDGYRPWRKTDTRGITSKTSKRLVTRSLAKADETTRTQPTTGAPENPQRQSKINAKYLMKKQSPKDDRRGTKIKRANSINYLFSA